VPVTFAGMAARLAFASSLRLGRNVRSRTPGPGTLLGTSANKAHLAFEEGGEEAHLRARPVVAARDEPREGEIDIHGLAPGRSVRDRAEHLLEHVRDARLVHAAARRDGGRAHARVRRRLDQEKTAARLRDAVELGAGQREDGRARCHDAAVRGVHARADGERAESGEGHAPLVLELREDEVAKAEPRLAALQRADAHAPAVDALGGLVGEGRHGQGAHRGVHGDVRGAAHGSG
jgi:hypothetical protein